MEHPANKIVKSNQATPGVEGFIFDGIDGSQMAFWTCTQTAQSAAHVHDFDEYMVVVEGCYTLIIDGRRIPLRRGDEYFIGRGTEHSGEVVAGTRTIHAFAVTAPTEWGFNPSHNGPFLNAHLLTDPWCAQSPRYA